MDRRLTPYSGEVALESLRGTVNAARFTTGTPARVTAPVVDVMSAADGAQAKRDRQLLFGAEVLRVDQRGAFDYVQSKADGYCGWVRSAALGATSIATHRVSAPSTHIYTAPDFKSPDRVSLSLGSRVTVIGITGQFAEIEEGWIPLQHLSDQPAADPVAVSESLIGTPYLWGGNSRFGIDCSGLVQIGMQAAGRSCPADSDLQRAAFPAAEGPPKRGDLMFWRGHVAWVADDARILHANSTYMCVMYEGIDAAKARIEAQGDGPFLGLHRP